MVVEVEDVCVFAISAEVYAYGLSDQVVIREFAISRKLGGFSEKIDFLSCLRHETIHVEVGIRVNCLYVLGVHCDDGRELLDFVSYVAEIDFGALPFVIILFAGAGYVYGLVVLLDFFRFGSPYLFFIK